MFVLSCMCACAFVCSCVSVLAHAWDHGICVHVCVRACAACEHGVCGYVCSRVRACMKLRTCGKLLMLCLHSAHASAAHTRTAPSSSKAALLDHRSHSCSPRRHPLLLKPQHADNVHWFTPNCRFWRVGCLVMVLHDGCDVLMEAAKGFNYTKRDEAATAAFAAFMVAWAALRLTCFPLMVIRSALFELPLVLGGHPPMWWGFCGGLSLLLCLHIYWFTLIVRVAWMKVVTGGGRDLREDDDGL